MINSRLALQPILVHEAMLVFAVLKSYRGIAFKLPRFDTPVLKEHGGNLITLKAVSEGTITRAAPKVTRKEQHVCNSSGSWREEEELRFLMGYLPPFPAAVPRDRMGPPRHFSRPSFISRLNLRVGK